MWDGPFGIDFCSENKKHDKSYTHAHPYIERAAKYCWDWWEFLIYATLSIYVTLSKTVIIICLDQLTPRRADKLHTTLLQSCRFSVSAWVTAIVIPVHPSMLSVHLFCLPLRLFPLTDVELCKRCWYLCCSFEDFRSWSHDDGSEVLELRFNVGVFGILHQLDFLGTDLHPKVWGSDIGATYQLGKFFFLSFQPINVACDGSASNADGAHVVLVGIIHNPLQEDI